MPFPSILDSKKLTTLQNCPLAVVYAAVVDRIANDITLADVVKRFEASPYKFDPTVLQKLPAVIIECASGTIDGRTAVNNTEVFRILVTSYVAAGNHVDLLNLDWAIRQTVKIRSLGWLDAALTGTGTLHNAFWTQPAVTYDADEKTKAISATSVLEVHISVPGC